MKIVLAVLCSLLIGCAQVGVVVTNAPASLGNCMPEKPASGCP